MCEKRPQKPRRIVVELRGPSFCTLAVPGLAYLEFCPELDPREICPGLSSSRNLTKNRLASNFGIYHLTLTRFSPLGKLPLEILSFQTFSLLLPFSQMSQALERLKRSGPSIYSDSYAPPLGIH